MYGLHITPNGSNAHLYMFLPRLDESPVHNTDEKRNPKFCCILLASLNILLLNLSETSGRHHLVSKEKILLLKRYAFEAKTEYLSLKIWFQHRSLISLGTTKSAALIIACSLSVTRQQVALFKERIAFTDS